MVYRLATRGTVEETLLLKADGKRKLEKLVIQKGKFKSLLDGGGKAGALNDEAKTILAGAGDDFEKYDVADQLLQDSKPLLTEEELLVLTDRSAEAYERAEKGNTKVGKGGKGNMSSERFSIAETKRGGDGEGGVDIMDDLTTRKGKR